MNHVVQTKPFECYLLIKLFSSFKIIEAGTRAVFHEGSELSELIEITFSPLKTISPRVLIEELFSVQLVASDKTRLSDLSYANNCPFIYVEFLR